MVSDFERPVWPIFAWISGALWAITLVLVWATNFIDGRWEGMALLVGMIAFFSTPVSIPFAAEGITYTRKPRGWRKLRRDKERQAYIQQLERETGINHE